MSNYVYLGLAIVCEVIATSFLAKSNGFTNLVPTAVAIGNLCTKQLRT